MTDYERNRRHHGHHGSDETGQFSIVTEEHRTYVDDGECDITDCGTCAEDGHGWQPEITIYLQSDDQLAMIRVVDCHGCTHYLEAS